MGREKKKAPGASRLLAAQARRAKHERAQKFTDGVWQNLNALHPAPRLKHRSYYESMQNTEKKKKLDFEILTDKNPPPGFEFVPTGYPELTQACKELSREQDALFFIVSESKDTSILDHHMNRFGCHFRQTIVDEAKHNLQTEGIHCRAPLPGVPGQPEPIPNSQVEINRQADAVLRDLFPRIPHTDRHEIIAHAFKKDGKFGGDYKVGMAKDLTLARRVQLAALAHIRHTMTRYDELLKETDWANARKAVEKPCLDVIVKWRGDEETGRDQLDEILREVIEISDSEDESGEESSGLQSPDYVLTDRSAAASPMAVSISRPPSRVVQQPLGVVLPASNPFNGHEPMTPPRHRVVVPRSERRNARKAAKAAQRFKRYAAAADAIADEGVAVSLHHNSYETTASGKSLQAPMLLEHLQNGTQSDHMAMSARNNGYSIEHLDRTGDPRSNYMVVEHEPPRHDAPFFVQRVQRVAPPLGPYTRPSERTPSRTIHVPRDQEEVVTYSGTALHDLLVPSVEPASPQAAAPVLYPLRDGPDGSPRPAGPRQIAGHPPYGHPHRPPDRIHVVERNNGHREHRQAVTFFAEDYERPSRPTLVPLPASDGARERALARYLYPGNEHMRTIVEQVPAPYAHAVAFQGYHGHDRRDAGPLSSQANPIMLGDDSPHFNEQSDVRHVQVQEPHPSNAGPSHGLGRPNQPTSYGGQQQGYVQVSQHREPIPTNSYTPGESRLPENRRQAVRMMAEQQLHSSSHHSAELPRPNGYVLRERMPQPEPMLAHRQREPVAPEMGPVYVDSRHTIAHYEPVGRHMNGSHPDDRTATQPELSRTQQTQAPIYVGQSQLQSRPLQPAQPHQPIHHQSHGFRPHEVIWVDD
ncbi:hypothetical protein Micbo1qcDRAFT_5825 [Microdochium bolleyi]|uniref:DUF2293 domain-containing protein n=1 Tax=Microdochium bolleyi TaxID=196109 RepID=A0A136JJ08_9PEZI|nr:hypothetical protein Micbo1qcDRAFT_5825 [Microdochium bolleyi]